MSSASLSEKHDHPGGVVRGMKRLSVILATLAVAACQPQPANNRSGQTDFAAKPHSAGSDPLAIFSMLESEAAPGDNIVYSPMSTTQAIGIVQLGARGETATQIEAVLGIREGEAGAKRLNISKWREQKRPISIHQHAAIGRPETFPHAPLRADDG